MTLVELKDFSKIYKPQKNKFAVSNVNLKIESGMITGILGVNGAGKSTILKAISGIFSATSGSVAVCQNSNFSKIKKYVSFAQEIPSINFDLTVKENLYFTLLNYHSKNIAQKKCAEYLNAFFLSEVASKKTSTLSKGYCQRLNLALALCAETCICVLDEFCSGLDAVQTEQVQNFFKEYIKKNPSRSLVVSTHQIFIAQKFCDYVYIVDQGNIVAKGSVKELILESGCKNLTEAFLFFTGQVQDKNEGVLNEKHFKI